MTIIVDNNKFVFYHIPKNAGKSVKQWFKANIKDSEIYRDNTGLYHVTAKALLKIYEAPEISSCIVRNPWDRTVSFYHHCLKAQQIDSSVSFYDFVVNRNMFKTTLNFFGANQWDYVEGFRITHILRFENLDEDFKNIQNIFSCYESLPKVNSTNHKHYLEYYTEKTYEEVAVIFKNDITNFNYDKLI